MPVQLQLTTRVSKEVPICHKIILVFIVYNVKNQNRKKELSQRKARRTEPKKVRREVTCKAGKKHDNPSMAGGESSRQPMPHRH